jgi:prepilin-type N-terminal cleavage/methylation domain-containing protein
MKKHKVQAGPAVAKANLALQEQTKSDGFTLTELLVVVATVGVLAAVLLPAFAQTKGNSQSLQCLENTRRLTLAWRMYSEDNRDLIVYSSDDGVGTIPYSTTVPRNDNQGNNYAWTWSKMGSSGSDPYNYDTNADITLRPLWRYVKNTAVYKCPADPSTVIVSGSPYTNFPNGSVVPRVRSYSMNFFLGGQGNNAADDAVAHLPIYLKQTDFSNGNSPGPNKTFVFICERADLINWGNFETDFAGSALPPSTPANPAAYEWEEDLPSSYHDFSASLSFADGHTELHRWSNPTTSPPFGVTQLNSGTVIPAPYSQDVAWMQSVSARPN